MPGLNVTSDPLVKRDLPYPTSVVGTASRLQNNGDTDLAQALLTLQKSLDDIHAALRQNSPNLKEFVVNGADGTPVVRLGNLETADGRIFYGAQVDALYAGDPLNTGDPAQAILSVTPDGHVQIGSSGWIDVVDPYGRDAAWLGSQFDTFPVTGAVDNGAGLIRLTVTGHTLLTGDKPRILNVGGVPNATGIFTVTKIDANHLDLQGSVWDGAYTAGGAVDRILHVTGAANDGTGLIRLTVTAHAYESGDTVNVLNVGGVPNATGQWIVTRFDANHFDLNASTWAGGFTAGGIVLRYAGGGQFQNISIGPSFWDYRLRAFPDGSLKIRNASIIITQGSRTISISPDDLTGGIRIIDPFAESILIGSSISFETLDVDGNIVSGPRTTLSQGGLIGDNSAGGGVITLDSATGQIKGYEIWANGTLVITHDLIIKNVAVVDSGAYKIGGVAGIAASQNVVEDIAFTTASFLTSASGPGVTSTSSAAAVTGATTTLRLLTFNGGLLTADT